MGHSYLLFRHKISGKLTCVNSHFERIRRLQRRVISWIRFVSSTKSKTRLIMVSLTYDRNQYLWKPNQIRDYLHRVKMRYQDKILGYAWVCELGSRGTNLHYHILFWVRGDCWLVYPDKSRMWRYGSSTIDTARTPYYLAKYISKGSLIGNYPDGCRIYAATLYLSALSKIALDTTEDMLYKAFRYSNLTGKPYFTAIKTPLCRVLRPPGGGILLDSDYLGEPIFFPSTHEMISVSREPSFAYPTNYEFLRFDTE